MLGFGSSEKNEKETVFFAKNNIKTDPAPYIAKLINMRSNETNSISINNSTIKYDIMTKNAINASTV